MKRQAGFSLISAIFVIVVLTLILSFMVRVSIVQSSTVGLSVSGTQAFYAARGGLQWGVHQAVGATPSCVNETEFEIDGYQVTVQCTATSHSDPHSRQIMRIISRAERGARGQPDFVARVVEATVAPQ